MTVNLLSQRLKDVKRELTALKTVHMRGLGSMRTFTQKVIVPQDGHTGIHDITVVVTTDNQYAPYPFISLFPAGTRDGDWTLELTNIFYNNSYTITFKLLWLYDEGTNAFYVTSFSPIKNITYAWD